MLLHTNTVRNRFFEKSDKTDKLLITVSWKTRVKHRLSVRNVSSHQKSDTAETGNTAANLRPIG